MAKDVQVFTANDKSLKEWIALNLSFIFDKSQLEIASHINQEDVKVFNKYFFSVEDSFLEKWFRAGAQRCLNQMSFKNKSFDIVCGISILHHVNTKKTLQECYRVLKDGGRLFFTEPNLLNPIINITTNIKPLRKVMEYSRAISNLPLFSYLSSLSG